MSKGDEQARELGRLVSEGNGSITASRLVEHARDNKDSNFHNSFEWDDSIAGQEYRLQQARRILRVIAPVIEGKVRKIMINVPPIETKKEGYYVTTEVIQKDRAMFDRAMSQIFSQFRALGKSVEEMELLMKGK